MVTSQVVTYPGKTGLTLKTPLKSLHTKGDFPNGTLQTGFLMLDKAECAELTEIELTPVLKCSVKNYIYSVVA